MMKKFILALTMVLAMAFSAICSASNGKVLDSEEAIVAKFIGGNNYKAVSTIMTAEMQKAWDEKTYANFQEQITKSFGKINTNEFIGLEKNKDIDILYYEVTAEKQPLARLVYVFTVKNEKPLLTDFQLLLPKAKDAAPAEAQK